MCISQKLYIRAFCVLGNIQIYIGFGGEFKEKVPFFLNSTLLFIVIILSFFQSSLVLILIIQYFLSNNYLLLFNNNYLVTIY